MVSPTLGDLGKQFGAAPMIGKTLAPIADANLSKSADVEEVVGRLKSISGEDQQTVHRKYKEAVDETLRVRFVISCDRFPNLVDPAGALMARVILLRLPISFKGREDHRLGERLLTELPGILVWAFDGLRRLRKRGYFVQPASGVAMMKVVADLAAPVAAFVRQECVVAPAASALTDDLYHRWLNYCGSMKLRETNRSPSG